MDEIQTALIAIALVLSAVFLPMAFFGGSVGEIYRQFSITMVAAMVLSVMVALVLSPALAATLLQAARATELAARRNGVTRHAASRRRALPRLASSAWPSAIGDGVKRVLDHGRIAADASTLLLVGVLVVRVPAILPTSFLPVEDQGRAQLQFTLPPGATHGAHAGGGRRDRALLPDRGKGQRADDLHRRRARARRARARMPAAASSRSRPGTSARAGHTAPQAHHAARHASRWRACATRSSSR